MKFEALRSFDFVDTSVNVERVGARDGNSGVAGFGFAGREVDVDGCLAFGRMGDRDVSGGDDGD